MDPVEKKAMKRQTSINLMKQIVVVLVILLLSSALFLPLYKHDNRYQNDAPQPIGGILFITQSDMRTYPVRYLWNGWNFYPDQLLTPQTLINGKNVTNIQIGKYGNFSMGDNNRNIHGSGSYELTIVLPKETASYAIELPEIYSSYRFYINDKLILEMGNPDVTHYTEKIQNRTVEFEAHDKVTFLIAVTDVNHYYSGMIYPPAFGDVLKVNTQRDIRNGLSLALSSITFMFAVFSLYIFIKTKRNNSFIFFILAVSTTIMISYSAVHGIISMPSQPWYTIELLSGYITIFMIVILHNRICKVNLISRMISTITVAIFALLMFLYGTFSMYLNAQIVLISSYLIVLFKVIVSSYLIILSAQSFIKSNFRGKILFYSDIFFASSLLWDFLLQAYEPIYGGWFQEWGCLSLVGAAGVVLWNDMARGYRYSLTFAEEQRQMQRQLYMQQEHYRQISNQVNETRRMRHDFRQHLRTILSMAKNDHEICTYIQGISSLDVLTTPESFCENHAIDALIQYYTSMSKAQGIKYSIRLNIPDTIPFPVVEICTMIGNLFENAIEASARLQDQEKTIDIKAKLDLSAFYFVIQNNFDDILIKKKNKYISRKHEGYGIGLRSVKEIAKKYNGIFEVNSHNAVFKASIVLPCPEQ